MTTHRRILGLGTVVVDLQMMVDRLPEPDTKGEAVESHIQVGGPVPTALALLSRFGHDCSFYGVWGGDLYGWTIEEDFNREGIAFDPAHARTSTVGTGTAHVWVERSSGRRTIVCHRAQPPGGTIPCDDAKLAGADVLHLDGWPGPSAVRAAKIVQTQGGLVALDAGLPKTETADLIEHVTLLNCPRQFVREFLGTDEIESSARELLSRGPRTVTITDGRNGAWLFTKDAAIHQPAFDIEPVDTTGAGDVFSGGLIHGYLQDWPPERTLAFASACAALKCTHLGNRAALPTLEEVERLIASE